MEMEMEIEIVMGMKTVKYCCYCLLSDIYQK